MLLLLHPHCRCIQLALNLGGYQRGLTLHWYGEREIFHLLFLPGLLTSFCSCWSKYSWRFVNALSHFLRSLSKSRSWKNTREVTLNVMSRQYVWDWHSTLPCSNMILKYKHYTVISFLVPPVTLLAIQDINSFCPRKRVWISLWKGILWYIEPTLFLMAQGVELH
jgi:hypothetical protein